MEEEIEFRYCAELLEQLDERVPSGKVSQVLLGRS